MAIFTFLHSWNLYLEPIVFISSANLFTLPQFLISGVFFPTDVFPPIVRTIADVLPLTMLNDSLRAVMNDGAPLAASWSAVSILLAWCVISFVVALKIFRWQ